MLISKLTIIIPVYNEARTISQILEAIKNAKLQDGIEKEIILVDDCSNDGTDLSIQEYMSSNPNIAIKYFRHDLNKGKGAAIHTGISKANGEFLIIQDADLEYDPNEYSRLLDPVIRGFADVVYGSRFTGGHPHRILFYWHTVGNRLLTLLSNAFTNLNLTDMETCYKLLNTKLAQSLNLKEQRFGFEPEVTAKISRIPNLRIYEVGISYYGRTYKEGKKINWKDGFAAIFCIIKYGLFSK